jgi:UDP-glucuronate 4-epimerase
LAGEPIEVFNNGNMKRDFTYIDDIVEGIAHVVDGPAKANPTWDACHPDPATSAAPFRVFNIGRGAPVKLLDFVSEIESQVGIKAVKILKPMQDGDVGETCADVSNLDEVLKYKPQVSVSVGVARFITWYKQFYEVEIGAQSAILS